MKLKSIAFAAALAVSFGAAQAQISDNVVRIGVLTDLSGLYSDVAGKGTVIATQMAIDDFIAKEKPAFKIEMVSADHQNKGDVAANKAREWFEREKVDVATELVTTSVALAVQKIARRRTASRSYPVPPPPASRTRTATTSRCIGPTTPTRWPTARPKR